MKWLLCFLLAVQAALAVCVLVAKMSGNLVVLLLACNSVLLIWTATRLRRKPSCCR